MPLRGHITHTSPLFNKTVVMLWCRAEERLSPAEQHHRLCIVKRECEKRKGIATLRFYSNYGVAPWRLFVLCDGSESSRRILRIIASRYEVHSEKQENLFSLADLPAGDIVPTR